MSDKSEGESVEENQIHCYSYMDKSGRMYIPLRHREMLGLEKLKGAEFELVATVKRIFT